MIFIKIFRSLLYDPRLRNLSVNDPKLLAIHSKILHEKKQLKKVFNDFYDAMLRCNKNFVTSSGDEIELGSGVGFFKSNHPNLITTDVRSGQNIEKYINAQKMKIKSNSLSCIYAINVFHHLENPDMFLREISRVLKPGGGCILIEPHEGFFSAFVHKFMHKSEIFDTKQDNWYNKSITGPLSGANQALAYIVFKRDLKLFKSKYGNNLEIKHQEYVTNGLRYFLTGGLNFRQILPSFLFFFVKILEITLSSVAKFWTLHQITVILKKTIKKK
ncbi:Methyltransferase type 11 [Methylophilaceae bacterium]